MIFKKRLNNNAVIAEDEKGREKILVGCGLGFQKKEGSEVEEQKIEKIFSLEDAGQREQLKELLQEIPVEHVKLAMDLDADYTVLRDQIYTHPTMSEALGDLFAV